MRLLFGWLHYSVSWFTTMSLGSELRPQSPCCKDKIKSAKCFSGKTGHWGSNWHLTQAVIFFMCCWMAVHKDVKVFSIKQQSGKNPKRTYFNSCPLNWVLTLLNTNGNNCTNTYGKSPLESNFCLYKWSLYCISMQHKNLSTYQHNSTFSLLTNEFMLHLFTAMNYQVTNDTVSPWQYKDGYVNIYIKEVSLYEYEIFSNAASKIVKRVTMSHWHLNSPGSWYHLLVPLLWNKKKIFHQS